MNYKDKTGFLIACFALLFSLIGCQGNNRRGDYARDVSQGSTAQLKNFTGRIYLGGSEFSEFIGLQVDASHAYYLLGADSLRNYQDFKAIVTGRLVHPKSDSIIVTRVKIINLPHP